jgi:phosphoglucomutase
VHADTPRKTVVIAHDSRRYSSTFALDAALVLCGNGITTYLFPELRPTPELSFAVRHLGATAGIVVTASHNPARYNGYKVYWSDGGQIVPPHDKGIIEQVLGVEDIRTLEEKEARETGLLLTVDPGVDDAYLAAVTAQALHPELLKERGGELNVVYTPLHGAGGASVERVLNELGLNITFVEEQHRPDGAFPTVEFPNPEEASAMQMACELGKKTGADLVMGTDPDADRLGIAVPEQGDMRLITGNQLGALLADYVLSTRREQGTLPPRPVFIKTIVTTELQRLIAEDNGVACMDTLTGFKYIAEKIRQFESSDDGPQYVLGGEESYGYLVGTAVRDKDSVSAAAMTAEMALYHKSRGSSLLQRLGELYEKHGYFEEVLVQKYFEGHAGLDTMKRLMEHLRQNPPATFAGQNVVAVKDYLNGTTTVMASGDTESDIDLPSSNVLQFFLSDMSIVTARPSGTEPKIKFYASCRGAKGLSLAEARKAVDERLALITQELNRLGS